MLSQFLPQQKGFFLLFRQSVDQLVKAAEEFKLLVNDLPAAAQHAKMIANHERQGDEIALATFQLLHKTFITPFDRHDIHDLTTHLDDVLDQLHRLAQRFLIYRFTQIPGEVIRMADLCLQVTEHVRIIVDQLDSLKNQANILQTCSRIDELENDAETILLKGISKLFETETDCKQLLKLKEVYEQIKAVINLCQDTANVVKSIVLEYA